MKLLMMFFVVTIAGEASAIPDPGCYQRNPRCTFGPPSTTPGPGNYRCPRGERPWIEREDALPRCRRTGNTPDRRRRRAGVSLTRAERVLVEQVTVAINTYIGNERVREVIDGEASISLSASERYRRSARRRFSNVEDLRRYVRRVHCRSARAERFPNRGRAKLTYGGNTLWIDDARVSLADAELKVYATYITTLRSSSPLERTTIVSCDKRRS